MVLYQLRRGALPFGDDAVLLPQLISNINTVEPVHEPLPLPQVVSGQEGSGKNGGECSAVCEVFSHKTCLYHRKGVDKLMS